MALNRFPLGVAAALLASTCGFCETESASPPPAVELFLLDAGVLVEGVSVEPSGADRFSVFRTIPDVRGTYTIPYIQSSSTLELKVAFHDPRVVRADIALRGGERVVAKASGAAPDFAVRMSGLPAGEYSVEVEGLGAAGGVLRRVTFERVAIGTILAAIGDSITEGYYGHGFFQKDLQLRAALFSPDAVSRDGRNFPQFSPTTEQCMPEVNCFASFTTELNDLLTASWHHPVFIANEGWGGITSGGYLEMISKSENWRSRMRALRPTLWLIHLGVNDDRAVVPAETFANTMREIVETLVNEFGAVPEGILLAKPCYDYADGSAAILEGYCAQLDRLVAGSGARRGADFYRAFATEKARWYGEDPVHPNIEGMSHMGVLWHEAIVKQIPGTGPLRLPGKR